MNVEIGAEAAQFPEKEYINGIADAVCPVQCVHIVQVDMSARNTTKYCLCKFLLINGMYEEKTLSAIFTVLEPSTKKRFANTERPYCTAYCFVTNYCNDKILSTLIVPLHCNGNSVYVFLFWELRGPSPNFHIHVSVSDLNIPGIGPHIWLQQNRQTDPGNI